MFVCYYYPPVGRKYDSVDKLTDGVCSSYLLAPFQASQYPNGGDDYDSIRLGPDHKNFWWWKHDLCRLNRPAPSGGNAPLEMLLKKGEKIGRRGRETGGRGRSRKQRHKTEGYKRSAISTTLFMLPCLKGLFVSGETEECMHGCEEGRLI